jgi:4a-hydroxytetrahydrobiopterin dehydratase
MNIRTFKGFVSDESNWNESVDGLTKEFSFSTQTDLAEFLVKVAKLADENDHHPDAEIYKAFKLRLKLFTHSKKAVTDLDRRLAKLIDSI